jgi:hypothetical protein
MTPHPQPLSRKGRGEKEYVSRRGPHGGGERIWGNNNQFL